MQPLPQHAPWMSVWVRGIALLIRGLQSTCFRGTPRRRLRRLARLRQRLDRLDEYSYGGGELRARRGRDRGPYLVVTSAGNNLAQRTAQRTYPERYGGAGRERRAGHRRPRGDLRRELRARHGEQDPAPGAARQRSGELHLHDRLPGDRQDPVPGTRQGLHRRVALRERSRRSAGRAREPEAGVPSKVVELTCAGAGPSALTDGAGIAVLAGTYGANCGPPRGTRPSTWRGACNGRAACTYTIDYQVIGASGPGTRQGLHRRVALRERSATGLRASARARGPGLPARDREPRPAPGRPRQPPPTAPGSPSSPGPTARTAGPHGEQDPAPGAAPATVGQPAPTPSTTR